MATYTLTATVSSVNCLGGDTVNLPNSARMPDGYTAVLNISGVGNVSVVPYGTDRISGSTGTYTLTAPQTARFTIYSNTYNWYTGSAPSTPTISAADAGKSVVVNSTHTGYELGSVTTNISSLTGSGLDATKFARSDGAGGFIMDVPAGGSSLPTAANDHMVLTTVGGTASFQLSTPIGHMKVTGDVTLTLNSPSYLHVDPANGTINVTLPSMSSTTPSKTFVVIQSGDGVVNVISVGSNYMDGSTTQTMTNRGEFTEVTWAGSAEVTQ